MAGSGWRVGADSLLYALAIRGLGECNRIDVTAIIRLGVVGRAAKAEKSLRIGVSAAPQILKLANPGASKPFPDIASQIEQGMPLTWCRDEETLTTRILGSKPSYEIR